MSLQIRNYCFIFLENTPLQYKDLYNSNPATYPAHASIIFFFQFRRETPKSEPDKVIFVDLEPEPNSIEKKIIDPISHIFHERVSRVFWHSKRKKHFFSARKS